MFEKSNTININKEIIIFNIEVAKAIIFESWEFFSGSNGLVTMANIPNKGINNKVVINMKKYYINEHFHRNNVTPIISY